MVAFHGTEKPDSLQSLFRNVLDEIARHLGPHRSEAFEPYGPRQVHATMIAMEVDVKDGQLFNRWAKKNRGGQERVVDTRRLKEIVRGFVQGDRLFTVRFGGFREAYCNCKADPQDRSGWACPSGSAHFHSCDRSTYEGSFYAFSPGPVVVTGWPVGGPEDLETFPHTLYSLRAAVEEAGFCDKYHSDGKAHWKDDDCYIRLGTFAPRISGHELRSIERGVRNYLSTRDPITVDVDVADVSILLYDAPSLAEEDVKARVPLALFLEDESHVDRLYDQIDR